MAFVIVTPNPYEPLNSEKHVVESGVTILQWLQNQYPGFTEFETATICLVNGEAKMRKDWNYVIQEKDIVNFIALQGEVATIIAIIVAVIVIAIGVALALSMPTPTTPGEQPASDPVFTIKGQQNAVRLGEPIEVCYGRNRVYPSYASRPFYQYVDNDQFQFSLFCLGQGEFEIQEIRIGDTDINDYQEVQYEVLPPGVTPTLFPANVYTAPEAGGQTLFATNDPEFTADGWVGPFPASPSGSDSIRIEVDIVFPKGIYFMKSSGKIITADISIEVQARPIDDAGVAIGPYETILTQTVSGKTTTPQRRTFGVDLYSPDIVRYEVRVRRTDAKPDKAIQYPHRSGEEAVWESLRSTIDTVVDFGDVTLLAVKIRATNNLNDRTAQKFNVICTRKLPIYESGGGWSAPIATRSIIWAFVDVFKSLYGGRVADTYLDFDTLLDLDAFYTTRGEYFDWVFRDPITVWDAARAICQVGRSVPMISGSLITIRRDGPLDIPVTLFTPDNIIKGTFEWDIKLWDLDEHDSIRVEYTEPATEYKQETVLCTLPGGTTDNPEDLRIIGVQDRNHAYRQGLYLLATKFYLRENIIFETGLEGFIPDYGDLIAVAHDVPRWDQHGYIVAAEEGVAGQFYLFVSEELNFEESGSQYVILLRGRQGEVAGPYNATPTDDPKQIVIVIDDSVPDFLLGGENEPMLFMFGVLGQTTKLCKVVRIEPQGGERIKITAVNDDPIIHSFDALIAPPLTNPFLLPEVPDLPVIANLYLTQLDIVNQIIQVSWTAAFGAQKYIVQKSTDNVHWEFVTETTRTAIQLQAQLGDFYVRVAAINEGQGPWITESINIGYIAGLVINDPWDNDLEWGVTWIAVLNAVGYEVKVYDNFGASPILKRTETLLTSQLTYLYDYTKAVADFNTRRKMKIEVDAIFEDEVTGEQTPSGSPASQTFENAVPEAPTGLGYDIITDDSDSVRYRLFFQIPYEVDIVRLKVWWSFTANFNPAVTSPVIDEIASDIGHEFLPEEVEIDVPLDSFDGHDTVYWRVGVFDVWGNEISTNISAQEIIPPFPT